MISPVCAACEPDPTPRLTSGAGIPNSSKEHVRHGRVVVLSGVHQRLSDAVRLKRRHDRRGLHEVRPGADDVKQMHRASCATAGWRSCQRTERAATRRNAPQALSSKADLGCQSICTFPVTSCVPRSWTIDYPEPCTECLRASTRSRTSRIRSIASGPEPKTSRGVGTRVAPDARNGSGADARGVMAGGRWTRRQGGSSERLKRNVALVLFQKAEEPLVVVRGHIEQIQDAGDSCRTSARARTER